MQSDLTNKQILISGLVALSVFLVAILIPSSKSLGDPDGYLHVATGQWILQHMAIPATDPFSYVKLGEPWVAHEWLSQVIMAIMYYVMGWYGIVLIASLAYAATLFIQYRFLVRHLEPVQTTAFMIFSGMGLLTHFLGRPHVLVWPLMAIWVASLLTSSERGQRPSYWLLFVLLLWTNMHGSFILALVLLLFIAVDAVLNDASTWTAWLIFGLLSVLVCTINPHGWQALLFPFDLKSLTLLTEIKEWAKPSLLAIASVIAVLIMTVFYLVLKRIRIPWVFLPLFAALVFQASSHARYVSITAFLVPFFLRAGAKSRGPNLVAPARFNQGNLNAHFLGPAVIALVCVVTVPMFREYEPPAKITPEKAVNKLISENVQGNGINLYGYGGYLIYRGVPVFIDGRADLYQDPHLTKYFRATRSEDMNEIRSVIDEFDIQWSMFGKDSKINRFFEQEPGWEKFYEDDVTTVYRSTRKVDAIN